MSIPIVSAVTDPYYRVVVAVLAAVLGLCVGSFLNVVIYRVPLGMSLSKPPSHCPRCGYRLRPWDNIPVISYLILRGRCRNCHEPISFRYTAVELLNMILWLLSALLYMDQILYGALAALVCSVCLCVCFIDWEHMVIPDRFQVMLLVLGGASILFDRSVDWVSHVIGFAAGGLIFLLLALVMGRLLGREALGGGDVKFAAAAGLILGWEKLVLMMLVASVTGSIVMLIRNRRAGESRETPFAPFLTLGLVIALFAGDPVLRWYITWLTA